MNNEKIGKFIAKLRKAKNLTQQQLGDMVGVGGKSVSKWERGINMPDISIINEVSKILGITSDELLKGEFNRKSTNEEYIKKKNKKITRTLLFIIITLTILITIVFVSHFRNETHKYWLTSIDDNFSVDGTIEYDKNGYIININRVYCDIEECKTIYVKSLKYAISINGIIIYKNTNDEVKNDMKTINEYLDNKEISLTSKYRDGLISYNDLMEAKSTSIIIEGYDFNEKQYKYQINLEINDKKD